jgi:hypothetical protein
MEKHSELSGPQLQKRVAADLAFLPARNTGIALQE